MFELFHYADEPSIADESGADVLKQLFARGLSIEWGKASQLFHPLKLNPLIDAGLVYEEGSEIKARFQAQPYRGLIFLSDFFQWENALDFVLPIGPAGHYLALLTVRRQVQTALDLGCGCGIQTLLAAQHSQRVIATDINPRALALTRLNADLNGIGNVEIREGSYFEPVGGLKFDMMVTNLPYAITPETGLIYRNVDRPGDEGIQEVIRQIPGQLAEGGIAQALINWVHRKDQDPAEPIRQAVAGKGVDGWLIQNGSKGPAEYTGMWIKHPTPDDSRKFERATQNWLRWYRRHQIERIGLGAITLRRRSADRNWFRTGEMKKNLEDPAGEQLVRLFAIQDLLEKLDDSRILLGGRFTPVDLEFVAEQDHLVGYTKRGLRLELEIHPVSQAALPHLDGTATLEMAIEAVCHEAGYDIIEVQDQALADFRKMLELGMVVPAAATEWAISK